MPSSSSSSFATWGSRLLSLPRHGHNSSNNNNNNNNNNNTHGQVQGGDGGQHAQRHGHAQGQGRVSSDLDLVLPVSAPGSIHHGGLSTEACSNSMLDPSAAADAPTVATPLPPTSTSLLSSSSGSMASSLSQHNRHHHHQSPSFLPSCPSSLSPSPSSSPSSSASSSPHQHHSLYSQLQQQQSRPPRIITVQATTPASSPTSTTSETYRSNYNNAIPVTTTAGPIPTSTTSTAASQQQPHWQPQLLSITTAPQQHQHSPSLSRASSTSSFFVSSPPPDRPAPPPPRPPLHSNSSSNFFLRRPTRNPFRTSSSSSAPSNPTTVADPSLTSSNSSFSLRGKKKKAKTLTPTRQEQQKGLPPTPPHSSSRSPFAHSHPHSHSQQSASRPPSTHSLTSSLSGSIKVTLSLDDHHPAKTTPSSSLKGSIANSLFSIKRRRRLPLPFWTGESSSCSPSPSSSDTDQETPTPLPRPRPRLASSSALSLLSPSIQLPTTTSTGTTIMQQVEYMPDSTQAYHPMQQAYDGPTFHQDVSQLPLHPSSSPSSSSSSTTTTQQKQTLSSKRMRPPLSEISTANIPSSSTTLISSDASQRLLREQQQQPTTTTCPPFSRSQNNKSTIITRINPNQGGTEEDQAKHLHVRARFVSPSSPSSSSSTTQLPGQSLPASLSSGLVTIATSPSRNSTNAGTAAASGNPSSSRLPDQPFPQQGVNSPLLGTPTPSSATASIATSRIKGGKKSATRAKLSRDARAIKTRIRRLWMDPTQEEYSRTRRDPQNQYLLLEESLTGILQIVPPIIENARIPNSSPRRLSYPTRYSDSTSNNPSLPRIMPMSMDFSAATGSIITPLSPPHPLSVYPVHPLPTASLVGSAPSKSSGGSTTNSMNTTATGPAHTHTRARTTSSNSTSTISATRYQIATSMLQPSEPLLMDIAQPTLRSPTSGASLGEPSLSVIAAAAAAATCSLSPNGVSSMTDSRSTTPHMAESNKILISKLLSLSNAFTGSIRALCEQQNEKVLRFDDDMILELLTRWEQEAGKEEEEGSEPELDDSSSTTSLVTLGATNALERYQIIVGRVWEETDVILSSIRKIRDLVEFGRIQHYSDFDDDDSEEDAIEKDEIIKKNLYSRLLFHANGLVTVLGEFLECVSGIQRLVSTIKTQRKSQEINCDELYLDNGSPVDSNGFDADGQLSSSVVDFISDDPIPVKHLDPALMRKLKRKTRFKTITEKVRRSFSDFAKRSTTSLLAVFPPLGDGTNEGFHWDSYSDGEYYSEEWVGTEWGSSLAAEEDSFVRTMSPPDSPGIKSEKLYNRHRRLSSKDSSGMPEQYWPGSTRLGLSDDGMSPTNSILPASPLSTSSLPTPMAGGTSHGGEFVDGSSMAMSRSMSSERTVNTIATRLHIGSPNNEASPPRKSLESLREVMELTGLTSAGVDDMVIPSSLSPTSPTQTGFKEKRQSLLFRRKSIQAPTFTGVSISAPIPIVSRPCSIYSSSGEPQSPSRNNYRVRPPRPPGSLPPMPPSPTPVASSRGDSFDAPAGLDSTGNIFKTKSNNRTSSYLASRSISPLQSSPLILDSPFTRQTSIRMGNDRNRYSVRMPEDEQWDQLSRSNTISSTNGSSSNSSNNSPRNSNSNFPVSFWRRRSYSDALEKSWQSMRQDSVALSSGGGFDASSPTTSSSRDFRSTFGGGNSSSSQSSVRVTSFEFMIPFFSRDGNMASSSASSSRQGSRPCSGSAPSQSGSERMAMTKVGKNRRHSSPLILGAERFLTDALSRRQSVSSQQSQSTSNSQLQQQLQQPQGLSNANSVHMMSTVDEKSKPQSAPLPRQNPEQGLIQAQAPKPAVAYGAVQFMESDPLSIPPRPRPTYKKATPESNSHSNGSRHNGAYVATSKATAEKGNGHREFGSLESRIPIDPARKPVIGPRFGDMKRAWEILNLDVKRLNQYSHMRAYAKGQPVQNNHWALSHPNAQQSTTSPPVLHFCENGTDVLVMEMFEGHLQIVAGLLEKLIERLADENAQDAEYVSCFLLSHSFFIDSEDLLDRLIARFHIQPRQGEILYFEKWHTVIQVKILCVLMRWIQIQYEDFELNANLLKTLRKFLEVDVRQAGFIMEAECIEKNISIKSLAPIKNCSVIMEQGRFCLQRSRTRKISLSRSQNSPNQPASGSALTSSPSKLEPVPQSPVEQLIEYGPTPELAASSPILQLNGQDLARYLTLADMKAFRSITVFELMSGWWKRRQAAENKRNSVGMDEDEQPKSPSGLSVVEIDGAEDGAIEAFTRRANMLSYWVAHEIVSTAGSKTRKQLIKKFIEVAKICRQLNNLHTSMFIVSALTSKPVRRLSSSWKLVSSRDTETLKNLEALMDPSGNMRCYRQVIAEAEAPTIPFLPILLKDITFILDGNPTMIASKASTQPQAGPAAPSTSSASTPTSGSTTPTPTAASETAVASKDKKTGVPLVNFDKFRRLTQYVENAVDMAKSVDYSFEHQLLRQARVFRPSSPSFYGETESFSSNGHGGGSSLLGGKSGNGFHLNGSSNGGSGPAPDGSRGALDHISEIVERRLVKASGLYGVHQRVIQVEFVNRAPGSKSGGGSSLWKSSSGAGGDGGSNNGSIHGSIVGSGFGSNVGSGSGGGDMVIRAVQGEEEYLMGLSRMCEPARW